MFAFDKWQISRSMNRVPTYVQSGATFWLQRWNELNKLLINCNKLLKYRNIFRGGKYKDTKSLNVKDQKNNLWQQFLLMIICMINRNCCHRLMNLYTNMFFVYLVWFVFWGGVGFLWSILCSNWYTMLQTSGEPPVGFKAMILESLLWHTCFFHQ